MKPGQWAALGATHKELILNCLTSYELPIRRRTLTELALTSEIKIRKALIKTRDCGLPIKTVDDKINEILQIMQNCCPQCGSFLCEFVCQDNIRVAS
jgi:hypothetical protein